MNNPFAKNKANRAVIPAAKNKAGFLDTQEPHEYANQAIHNSVTDYIWGTQTQTTNGDADFYTDGSGNPLDSAAAAVILADDDKILIGHNVTATANMALICGGKKVRLEMLKGVNWNLGAFDLDLGETGDSFSGDIELTGTGTLTIEEGNGLRIHHTSMAVVVGAGDVTINNDTILPTTAWRMKNTESVGDQDPLGAGASDWETFFNYPSGPAHVTVSNGIFSYPSTGYWKMSFFGIGSGSVIGTDVLLQGDNGGPGIDMLATVVRAGANILFAGSSISKITNISTQTARLIQSDATNTFSMLGAINNTTYVTFEKLGNL